VLAFAALDLGRYFTHLALHRVPPLWRLHRVHHSDVDYDCTTSLRFHPLESIVTIAVQLALVAALGAPPIAVLVYEIATVSFSLFSHGNLRIPARVERWLRWVVVTPDLHRVHHSAAVDESNANFASVLPWWDRLFRTYRAQPALGHDAMTIGLEDVRDARTRSFGWVLMAPFEQRRAVTT
jgi:sterol desaturase/sphingolipid hydroxylase (fatty acid hydroxylase superfamily)